MKFALVLTTLGLLNQSVRAEVPARSPGPRARSGAFELTHGSAAAGLLAANPAVLVEDPSAVAGAESARAAFRTLRRRVMTATDDAEWAHELFLAVSFTTDRSSGPARGRAALRTRAMERVIEDRRVEDGDDAPVDGVAAGFVLRGTRAISAFLRHATEAARTAAVGEAEARGRSEASGPGTYPATRRGPEGFETFSVVAGLWRVITAPAVMAPLFERYRRLPEFADWLRDLAEVARARDPRRWAHLHLGTLAAPAFVADVRRGDLVAAGRGQYVSGYEDMVHADAKVRGELRPLIVDLSVFTEPGTVTPILAEVVRYGAARPPPAGTAATFGCEAWLTR